MDATETFLNEALPAHGKAHVLAVGEFHNAKEHLAYLRKNLDKLKNEHNIKTIGVELPPMMNVLFSAYKDGALPVEKGKERAYVITMMQAFSNPLYPEQAAMRAEFLMDAIDKGIAVVGFDGRELLEERAAMGRLALTVVARHPEISQAMHASPDRSSMRQSLEVAVNDFKINIAKGHAFSAEKTEKLAWELGSFAMMAEIKQLCKEHPEYMRDLQAAENRNAGLRKQGKVGDEISAALLADAVGEAQGNILTLYGLTHLSGRTVPAARTDGKLGRFMRDKGWKVTPAALVGEKEFHSVMTPIEMDKGSRAPAVSVQPMNLLVIGEEEKANLLIRNLHQGVSVEDAGASDIGKYVASHLNLFATTQNDVAADRQGVLRSAISYLSQVILKDCPADSDLHKNIMGLSANKDATHADALRVMNEATRYLARAPIDNEKKKDRMIITRQLAGFLQNYVEPDSVAWQRSITAPDRAGIGLKF